MSYSRQKEVLEMPNLIEVQKDSYQWFLKEGLKEVFADISPISDYSGHLSLDFIDFTLCEDDVKYKKLTEQKDIQKIISILTSLKIYEHDPEPPEEAGVLNMKFEMHLTDGTIETIDLVESGFGYLTDQRRKLKVSYL